MALRAQLAVCPGGHARAIGLPELAAQIVCGRCRGWTWEDGNHCVRCGARLRQEEDPVKLIYEGMFDAVEVPEAGIVAARGEPVDVSDEVGERLLLAGSEIADDGTVTPPEHPDWRPAKARKEA
jgi:hypothetical protein